MSLSRFTAVLLCFSAWRVAPFAQSPVSQSAIPATPPAYLSDPHYTAAIHEGQVRTTTREYAFAIDAYRKANKIAAGNCTECLHQIVILQLRERDNKGAAKTANELIAKSSTPLDKSKAEVLLGEALLNEGGDKPKPAQLQAADQALKGALADYPRNVSARFLDGEVLARMGDTDAARKEFTTCIEQCSPTDPYLIRAKRFAQNPALSYAKMAPAFTVTALDGTKFTLDQMNGRVVLIDFWATWCGPCVGSLPHIDKIASDMKEKGVRVFAVNQAEDKELVQGFMKSKNLTVPVLLDSDSKVGQSYKANAIPETVVIGKDGIVRKVFVGAGPDTETKLREAIDEAVKAAK